MANPSNRRPWVLEMTSKATPGLWFVVSAFDNEREARLRMEIATEDGAAARSGCTFRVRHFKDQPEPVEA